MASNTCLESLRNFRCSVCNKEFARNSNLRRHILHLHDESVNVPKLRRGPKGKKNGTSSSVSCPACQKTYASRSALRSHKARMHKTSSQVARSPLRQGKEKRTLEFETYAEFSDWKNAEEGATMTRFVKHHGIRQSKKGGSLSVYYCHRSGCYKGKVNRRRHMKVQGTCKIGSVCPAAIFLRRSGTGSESLRVSYYPEHQGHDCELAHVTLRKDQREQIALKLASGVSMDDVLDSVHAVSSDNKISNCQLISRKDLYNIARDFGISKGDKRHKTDALGVAAWIERTRKDQSTRGLVRLIKYPDEPCEDMSVEQVACSHEKLPKRTVTQAILCHPSSQNVPTDMASRFTALDSLWSSVRSSFDGSEEMFNVVKEDLVRLKSLLSATRGKSRECTVPSVTTTNEPTNFLDRNIAVISHRPPFEHDYASSTTSYVIHSEHSYV